MAAPRKPLLTPANHRTLTALRAFKKSHGRSPSDQELADVLHRSKTAVRFQLRKLEEKGALVVEPVKPREIEVAS